MKVHLPAGPLRRAIVICAALSTIATALAGMASAGRQAAASEWQAAHALRTDAAAALARADDEASRTRGLAEAIASLRATGALGDERRADWLRPLTEKTAALRLPPLRHEFSSPRIDDGLLRSTQMRLQAMLLHEGDLLALLAAAHEQAPAVLRVRACRLERLPAATDDARLRADCRLDWHTFVAPPEAAAADGTEHTR